jgi:hypothetical protein
VWGEGEGRSKKEAEQAAAGVAFAALAADVDARRHDPNEGSTTPMRELPEVETIRRELDKEVSGKRVKSVEVPGTDGRGHPPPNKKHFAAKLEGVKIKASAARA